MKVLTALFGPADAAARARELRDAGAAGVFTFEGPHDVFAPLTLACTVGGLDVMTNVAIAFPRNPVQLAHQAYDHQVLSGGRFTLGLGTQVRAQVEKRYGVPFDRPVARMREFVGALRAVFQAWETGGRLDFRGEFYRHTLMTPTFNPGPNPFGPPPVYLGALGPRLTRAAAEVADGLLVMPFSSARFLGEVTMPAVRAGLATRDERARPPAEFAVLPEVIVSAGDDHEATRRLLAFYGSTPAYRPVLDLHGWGALQPDLNAMSKQGRWTEMGALVSDEMLHTLAACGTPTQIAEHIGERVRAAQGARVDAVCLYQPGPIGADALAGIVAALRSAGAAPGQRGDRRADDDE